MTYRELGKDEISQLVAQGCQCDDWSRIRVAKDFTVRSVWRARFFGRVKLGCFAEQITTQNGLTLPSGVYDATLADCEIGDNALIQSVPGGVVNYIVGPKSIIIDTHCLCYSNSPIWPRGLFIECVNESGVRKVAAHPRLSAALAYLLAFGRSEQTFIEVVSRLLKSSLISLSAAPGRLSGPVEIRGCGPINNVIIEGSAEISGGVNLTNGVISGQAGYPVIIKNSVTADNFIVGAGSTISGGVKISHCLVGQAAELSQGFSAQHSLIFANSVLHNGEGQAVFAGPYTVSHHKNTLLIAGYYSFFNAGSGFNQSNSLYRLGARHQGIVERGVKTASNAYALWPMRVGAFSIIKGSLSGHQDTGDLPFSYLIENSGKVFLVPGVLLGNIGVRRDLAKWPLRDRRPATGAIDAIIFDPNNPFVLAAIKRGLAVLQKIAACPDEKDGAYVWQNLTISGRALRKGLRFYEAALEAAIGDFLCRLSVGGENDLTDTVEFDSGQPPDARRVRDFAKISNAQKNSGSDWLDLAGLSVPKDRVIDFMIKAGQGRYAEVADLGDHLKSLADHYPEYKKSWLSGLIGEKIDKPLEKADSGDFVKLLEQAQTAWEFQRQNYFRDAQKEFAAEARVGYDLLGLENPSREFTAIFGQLEAEKTALQMKKEFEGKRVIAAQLKKALLDGENR